MLGEVLPCAAANPAHLPLRDLQRATKIEHPQPAGAAHLKPSPPLEHSTASPNRAAELTAQTARASNFGGQTHLNGRQESRRHLPRVGGSPPGGSPLGPLTCWLSCAHFIPLRTLRRNSATGDWWPCASTSIQFRSRNQQDSEKQDRRESHQLLLRLRGKQQQRSASAKLVALAPTKKQLI
jgi:hypothetical protein